MSQVTGDSSTAGVPAVLGTSDIARGVQGNSNKDHGVVGQSTNGVGVFGVSTNSRGVDGLSTKDHGVVGESTDGAGVFGISKNQRGVQGESTKDHGVVGHSVNGTGVFGISDNQRGVEGHSTKDHAVVGISTEGIGIFGKGGRLAGHFEGDVEVTGTILAKDVVLAGGDCAEHFDVMQDVLCDPGTVMAIGMGGALDAGRKAYDKRVAGVVSGAGSFRPAIVLDKQPSDAGRPPIALAGKVYCKVDAQYGAIEVGDLLTSSETLGHAMKACDPTRAFGAVVGKALGPLPEGCGIIPILVTLQ